MERSYVVGIAGGSGSGKTTIARALCDALGFQHVALIEQDCYYRDQSHLAKEERDRLNFDHPEAIELSLLAHHVEALAGGEPIDKPLYDFAHHVRKVETERVEPRPVVVVEGIMVLVDEALRELMDLKIFVHTDADLRVIRRIRRDIEQRGRSFDQVRKQYYATVRPMHLAFVEPSKRHADLIVPEGGSNRVALDVLLARIQKALPSG
ncbi:MAG: uridine kinase [Polyangiaceae bacterium]